MVKGKILSLENRRSVYNEIDNFLRKKIRDKKVDWEVKMNRKDVYWLR